VDVVAGWHGGKVIRVPVGRQAAMDALASYRPEQIALAGEGTGAVMMPQFRFVYDGIASMLAILSMMRQRHQALSEILRGYPEYSILKGELPLATQRIPALFMEMRERYRDGHANVADGLRVDWKDRWFHVRVSQTEPIVRVIAERRGDPPRELFESLMEQIRSFA
jgi:phosphomannomutase